MREVSQDHWMKTLLTPEQRALVNSLFPFCIPPFEVARDTLLIKDPRLQLREAFHQTQSSIFLFPRDDKRLLVPVVAFNKSYPCMNLWVLCADTMAATCGESHRRWAVWLGRNLLNPRSERIGVSYTPAKADGYLKWAGEIKKIYGKGFDGSRVDLEILSKLIGHFVSGSWYNYYVGDLPQMINDDPGKARKIVSDLFAGLEESFAKAEGIYASLSRDNKLLLDCSFPLVVRVKITSPYPYFSYEIGDIRKGKLDLSTTPRDPLEIVGRTQGVRYNEVEGIYLPDEVLKTKVGQIVESRIKKGGLEDRMKTFSDLKAEGPSVYRSCDSRYRKFSVGKLVEFIREGQIVPLLPSEWTDWPPTRDIKSPFVL